MVAECCQQVFFGPFLQVPEVEIRGVDLDEDPSSPSLHSDREVSLAWCGAAGSELVERQRVKTAGPYCKVGPI